MKTKLMCFEMYQKFEGLAVGCEQRRVREVFHEYCTWKLKLALFFGQCSHAAGCQRDSRRIQQYLLTSARPHLWPWDQYIRCVYQCGCNSKLTIWTKKSLQKNIYCIWLYRFRISADSFYCRESIYATPKREIRPNLHRIKTLKRRENVALFAPLLCFPPFFVCLVLFHRCEWSCFPPQLQPPIKVLTPDALHTSMQ